MNNKDKAYIVTYTGKQFWLLEPRLEDIDIKDIAHALAMQCRWTGHCRYHYSIAQHSYYCSVLGPENEGLERLLHDASEAYMGDMNRPLKHYTEAGPAYRRQEAVVQEAIYQRFGVGSIEPKSVHEADEAMLYAEKNQIISSEFSDKLIEGNNPFADAQGSSKAANLVIERWAPEHAEAVFLTRFKELYFRRIN